MVNNNFCYGCMSNIENKSVCPNCGYIKGTENVSEYIQPGYILNDRYLIGKVIRFNGQGVNYIAYDKHNDRKVIIEEFFPDNLVDRNKQDFCVVPKDDKINIFNNLKSDFISLIKSVVKIRSENIIIFYDFFELNSTVYLVKEYIDGILLNKFLIENAGAVSWDEIKNYFKDLIEALVSLNNSNIIHKGVSPENIILIKNGDKLYFKLINFSISDLRFKNSNIVPELYSGYTSPEQYSSNKIIYDNTDVYSICAVLYKCLTGTTPVDAFSRSINDNMIEPRMLNNQIPQHISSSIINGLAISPDNRIKDMGNLYNQLFKTGQDFTRVYNKDTVVIQPSKLDEENICDNENQQDIKQKKVMFKALIITLPILIIILALLWIFIFMGNGKPSNNSSNPSNLSNLSSEIASQNISSSSVSSSSNSNDSSLNSGNSSSENKEYQMPNLVGKSIDIILNSVAYKEFLIIETEEIYSDQYEKNIIVEQNIKEGEAIYKNTKVIVKVSKGTRYPRIPAYDGLNITEYSKMLDALSIKYKIRYVQGESYKDGAVYGIDRTVGSSIDISENNFLNIDVVKNN